LSLIFYKIHRLAQFGWILTEEKGVVKEKYNPLWGKNERTTIYGGDEEENDVIGGSSANLACCFLYHVLFISPVILIDIKRPLNHNRIKSGFRGIDHAKNGSHRGKKILDVIKMIEGMTSFQQLFIEEMLSQGKKAPALPKKRILKKSFRLWADREDIKSSADYVNQLRGEWQSRLEGMKG
jgi:hypothetical protein